MGRIRGPLEHMQTPYVPYPLWEGRGNRFPWVLRPLRAPQAWIPPPTHRGPQGWVLFPRSPLPLPHPAGSPPPSGSLPLPAGPSGVELPKQACVQATWALSGQSGGLEPLPHSGSRTGTELPSPTGQPALFRSAAAPPQRCSLGLVGVTLSSH